MSSPFKSGKAGNRKIDSFGRITIPKNLRDNLGIKEDDEFEIGTTNLNGKTIIYLYKENLDNKRKEELLAELRELGIQVFPAEN